MLKHRKEIKMLTSHAPCGKCNLFGDNIRLTGETEPADDGGTWWRVTPNQFCINCGEPWNWLHIPPSEHLSLDVSQHNKLSVEKE